MEDNKPKIIYVPAFMTERFDKILEEYKTKKGTVKLHPWQVLDMLMQEHEEKVND